MLPRKDLYQLWLLCLFFIRSPSLKRITLLSQQKQQQRKEGSQPPAIKHPKPTAKSNKQQSPKQQTPEDPSSSKSLKTPGTQSPTATSTVKPVQPVYPLPDSQQSSESSTSQSVRDKSLSMQQYKAHRSPGGSSGNRPHSLVMITSPTSSVDHSNSDNNSGASTPLLYSERTSPSGSSSNTSVSGGHQQQRQHTKPPIALMQHSYPGDSGRRVTDNNKPFMTVFPGSEPSDVISLSQCSNSSRESSTSSNRSKREMRSPEQQMKFSSPDNQYNVESHMRNADMPTVALRHSAGGQRSQRDEQEVYMQPKRLGGYISDGAMSVTSSIEELTAINQTSDYNDQPPLQSNVVIVKPQPVAGTYYQHPAGIKDRHLSHDHKQHVHSSGQSMTSPNSKQAINNSHPYHTPQFASKGFPPGLHPSQFKNSYPPPHVTNSQLWATQRQGASGNNYSKQSNKAGVAASPPGVKEGKPRGYLAADGSDYTNEMIVSEMRYGFVVVCVCSCSVPING